MNIQLIIGTILMVTFGAITWAAWTDNLPIMKGIRQAVDSVLGEGGVRFIYLVMGIFGMLFGLAFTGWGMILLF